MADYAPIVKKILSEKISEGIYRAHKFVLHIWSVKDRCCADIYYRRLYMIYELTETREVVIKCDCFNILFTGIH